jgi:hypothetical protein
MKRVPIVLAVTLLASAVSAQAQDRELSRRQFPFFGNYVTVEVVADVPGKLQVVRGEEGMIEVAARVPGGIPSFALGGRGGDRLRLSALGGANADFVVIVPENAGVRVKLPETGGGQQTSTLRSGGIYQWGAPKDATAPIAGPAVVVPAPAGQALAFSNTVAPRLLNIANMNALRTLTVRIEGNMFQVGGSEFMSVAGGNPAEVQLQTGRDLQDVFVTLPIGTNNFTLRLGGRTALSVTGREIRVFCEPVTDQDLGSGRRWFTFTPEMGRLTCR